MADDNEQNVELDVSNAQETEVEVNEDLTSRDDDRSGGSDDQFEKAETATQKRIDRLTKKMREAERREQEAIKYAQAVQGESNNLKQRMTNLDTNYVTE
jgi:hypothetical protein